MTPDERHALIHRPFFLTRFSTGYQWAGRNTGGYLYPDLTGGRHIPRVRDDEGGGSNVRRARHWDHPDAFDLMLADDPITKLTVATVFGDITPTEEQIINGKE